MFSEIIISGIKNMESNEQIIATIETTYKTSISGSTRATIENDINWYRSNAFYNPYIGMSEASRRPFKTESF